MKAVLYIRVQPYNKLSTEYNDYVRQSSCLLAATVMLGSGGIFCFNLKFNLKGKLSSH